MFGVPAALDQVLAAERGAQLHHGEPCDEDLDVSLVRVDRGRDPDPLPLGESLDPAPQGQADPVQRVTLSAAWPRGSCCPRWRTSSTACPPNLTM